MKNISHFIDGPALAAILSAAIGCFVLGLMTVLAVASPSVKAAMNWWPPAGPLVGKTSVAVLAWLLSWVLLHLKWRKREINRFEKVYGLALVLITLSLLGTFPPFFELLSPH